MERYTRLFNIDKNLYANNSPVIIEAGALLKDNDKEIVLIQLKFKSITSTQVAAIVVKINGFDVFHNKIVENYEYQYLDLSINRNDEFGDRIPIYLEDNSVRSFDVKIKSVVFTNGDVLSCSSEEWLSIPNQNTLLNYLNDHELVKQYRIQFGNVCEYVPLAYEDLWLCTCGNVNHNSEESCSRCGLEFEKINNIDSLLADLRRNKDKRISLEKKESEEKKRIEEQLAEEKRVAEEKEKQRQEELRQKAILKKKRIVTIVACTIIILFVGTNVYNRIIKPSIIFSNAKKLYEESEYEKAKSEFDSLGEYKDASNWVKECEIQLAEIENKKKYEAALSELNSGDYEEAIKDFGALGDYLDSKDQLKNSKQKKYDKALELYKKGDMDSLKQAMLMFDELSDFANSKEMHDSAETDYYISVFCDHRLDTAAANFFLDGLNSGRFYFVDGNHIRNIIIGKWKIVCYDEAYGSVKIVDFFENGTTNYSELFNEWNIKNDGLEYGTSFGEDKMMYIKDNVYLTFAVGVGKMNKGELYIRDLFIKQK